MKLFSILIAFLFALFLTACATNASRIADKLASTPDSDRAYVIGSFAVECAPFKEDCNPAFNALSVSYKNINDKEVKGNITHIFGSMFGRSTVHDFANLDLREKGTFFCIALPAGSYAFHTIGFDNFAGGGSGFSIKEENQFTLPFNLTNSEVVNVGKLKISTTSVKTLLGVSRPAPGQLLISAGSEKDVKSALQKCPEAVRSKSVRNAILNIADAKGNPFVKVDSAK